MTTDHLLLPARLAALRSVDILDTPKESDFDDLCALAAHACSVPIALVNFIDAERQWFKSEVGLGCEAPPLSVSICRHALEKDFVEFSDLTQDERFSLSPMVAGPPHLRFYAGASLRIEGQPVGTVCILDFEPRTLSETQAKSLRTIATQVTTLLELRRKLRWQKESNAAKDEFLAKLSHELRTPLTPVLMTVSDIIETGVEDPRLRNDLSMILRNVQLEARLIDDLLDVTRITNDKLILKTEPIDLHGIVAFAVDICAGLLCDREIVPEIALDADRHWVHGDPARLQQVFWNLLTNATKFTPRRGAIKVTSENVDDRIRVSVRDSGRGIESGRLGVLFGIFEQGDRETTKSHGGLGLGLAICKGVVTAHGGEIHAESEGAGRGATFSVDLTTVAEAPKTIALPSPAPTAKPLQILLVEDHLNTGEVLGRLMVRNGHHVRLVTTVAAALQAAADQSFDVVVSDLGLPDGSGLDLMQQIRARHGLPGIALSGYGTPADVVACHAAGFVRHLLKPVDWKVLAATLRQLQSEGVS